MVTDPDETRRVPVAGPRPRFTISATPGNGPTSTLDPDTLRHTHPALWGFVQNILFWLTMTGLENPRDPAYCDAFRHVLHTGLERLRQQHPFYVKARYSLIRRIGSPFRYRAEVRVQGASASAGAWTFQIGFFQTWDEGSPKP